jgi:hypothetical protein
MEKRNTQLVRSCARLVKSKVVKERRTECSYYSCFCMGCMVLESFQSSPFQTLEVRGCFVGVPGVEIAVTRRPSSWRAPHSRNSSFSRSWNGFGQETRLMTLKTLDARRQAPNRQGSMMSRVGGDYWERAEANLNRWTEMTHPLLMTKSAYVAPHMDCLGESVDKHPWLGYSGCSAAVVVGRRSGFVQERPSGIVQLECLYLAAA